MRVPEHINWLRHSKKTLDFEIVAACDAYTGRLERMKSRTDGRADIMSDYREILAREDIDAVVISSPNHWHYQHAIDWFYRHLYGNA